MAARRRLSPIEVVREEDVLCGPDVAWVVIDDVPGYPRWLTFAEGAEILGGAGVGRRQRLYGRWGKRRSEVDQVVIEHVPGERLAWRHEAERLDGKPAPRFARVTTFAIDLEPAGTGTRVRMVSRQEPAGRFKALVMRLFGAREVTRHMERSLDRLAAMISASGGAGPRR